MAISINSTPRTFEFARNAFGFGVGNVASRHSRAELWVGNPIIGDTLTLRWKDQEHVFTFVAAADSSGTQLTVSANAVVIAADFLKNTAVAEVWMVTAIELALWFYEVATSEYIPLFVEQTNTPFGLITEYNSLQYGFFSKLCADLRIKVGVDMVSKGKAFLSFVANSATVEIGPKLLPYFSEDTLAPNQAAVHPCAAVVEYAVEFSEFNPVNTPAYTDAELTSAFFALDGRIPYPEYPAFVMGTPVYPLSTLLPNTRTWREAHQEVTLLAVSVVTIVTFTAKIYFTDGTDTTVDVLASTSLAANQAYAIPAGFSDLGLDAYEVDGLIAYRYEVITSTGFTASFVLMDQPFLGKVLRYRNYKGGWQSLLTEGAEVLKSKSSITVGETKPVVGHAATTPTLFKVTGELSDSYELNLGQFYPEEMALIRDLLQSRFVYRQVGSAWKRLHITSESITLLDEMEDMNEAKIEYKFATPC